MVVNWLDIVLVIMCVAKLTMHLMVTTFDIMWLQMPALLDIRAVELVSFLDTTDFRVQAMTKVTVRIIHAMDGITNHGISLHMCDDTLLLVEIAIVVMMIFVMTLSVMVKFAGLHLQHEVATFDISVLRVEHASVAIE